MSLKKKCVKACNASDNCFDNVNTTREEINV